jgi:hypothetical protein
MKFFIVWLILSVSFANASLVLTPEGLTPGDSYRLVFVTSGTTFASSQSIAYYNSFVTNEANRSPELAGLNVTWTAIASTSIIDARDNTNTNPTIALGMPLFRLDGSLVSSDYLELWSGSLRQSISINQFGSILSTIVWTGTSPSGRADRPLGDKTTMRGISSQVSTLWINENDYKGSNEINRLYAISSPISSVPEPSFSSLFLVATFLAFHRKRIPARPRL